MISSFPNFGQSQGHTIFLNFGSRQFEINVANGSRLFMYEARKQTVWIVMAIAYFDCTGQDWNNCYTNIEWYANAYLICQFYVFIISQFWSKPGRHNFLNFDNLR